MCFEMDRNIQIKESIKADFYAALEYVSGHKYAGAALEKLFEIPMKKGIGQEALIEPFINVPRNNSSFLLKFVRAERQLDTLVDLGAARIIHRKPSPKYSITLKGHDACVTYKNLLDEALSLKSNDEKEARKLVKTWLRFEAY